MPEPSTPPNWNNPNDPSSGDQPSYGQSGQQPHGPGYGQPGSTPYGQPQAPQGPPPPPSDPYQGSAPTGPGQAPSGHEWQQQGYPTPPTFPGQNAYAPPQPTGAADPDDLSLPLYGASFMQSVKRFYKKYATFSGRASRSEYWWVVLYQGVIGLILAGAAGALFGVTIYNGLQGVEGSQRLYTDGKYYYEDYDWNPSGPMLTLSIIVGVIAVLWYLANLVPNIALTWRRLHDANFAGPFYFLSFTSVGGIVVLVMTLLPSKVEGQRFDAGNQPGQIPPNGYGQPDQYQPGAYQAPQQY